MKKKIKYKFFGKNIAKRCEYCGFAVLSETENGNSIQCPKHGLVGLHDKCLSYWYDPTKRIKNKTPHI